MEKNVEFYRRYRDMFRNFVEMFRCQEDVYEDFCRNTAIFLAEFCDKKGREGLVLENIEPEPENPSPVRAIKVLIGVPNLGQINQITASSLIQLNTTENTKFMMESHSLIYNAREHIAQVAIDEGYDYLLFIDSDIEFKPDSLLHLLNHSLPMVTGIYYQRGGQHLPVICKKIEPFSCEVEINVDRTDLIEIAGCGLGFCLIRVDVLKDVVEHYGKATMFCPIPGLGEDFAFCKRVTELGYSIFADPTIPLNHWGNIAFGRASFDKGRYER